MKGAFLFFAALRLAVAAPQSAPDQQLCSIRGTVTDALTHQGLRKAYLKLGVYPAVTDDRGLFTIDNIKPGTYPLTAEHPGYLDGEYGEADGAGVEITLAAGQTLTDINVKLTPQAVVSGRVLDEDGELWTHAFVNLLRSRRVHGQSKLEDFGGGELNDQGEFRIGRIPPGKYYLAAKPDVNWESRYRLPPPLRQPTWHPSSLDLDGANPIIVGPGDQVTGLEIRLRRGSAHAIRGTLVGIENIPPPTGPEQYARRRISVESTSGAGASGTSFFIGPNGSFEIPGLPPGTYEIRVTQGFLPISLGTAKVQVDDRDVDDVAIQLTPPQPLNGMIQVAEEGSKKPAGLVVELDPIRPGQSPYVYSRADGSFEFPPIGAERYRVSAGGVGHYLKEIRYGDVVSNDGTFTVTGAGGSLLLVLSTRVAHLTGRMSATAVGAPRIVLIPAAAGDVRQATLDQTGMFSFGDVRPGTYKLYAFEGAPDGAWEDPDFMKEFSAAGVEIHLDEGESKNADVPLIPKSDLMPVLKKLGIE